MGPEGEEDPADLRYVIMPELTPEESDIVGIDEIKMARLLNCFMLLHATMKMFLVVYLKVYIFWRQFQF